MMKKILLILLTITTLRVIGQNLPATQNQWEYSEVTINGINGISLNRYIGELNQNDQYINIPNSIDSKPVIALCYMSKTNYMRRLVGRSSDSDALWSPLSGLFGQNKTTPNTNVREVNALNANILHVGPYTFSYCQNRNTSISLTNNVKEIMPFAFSGSEIVNFNFPTSLEYLGAYTFYNCKELAYASPIPSTVTRIELGTFYGCVDLITSISHLVHENIEYIGSYAFKNCTSLEGTLTLPKQLDQINDGVFDNCSKISVGSQMPQSLKFIERRAFAESKSYTKNLIFNEGLINIADSAFYRKWYQDNGREIETIVFPSSLNSIESCAFRGTSSNLQTIHIHALTPPVVTGKKTFDESSYRNTTLYVPQGTLTKYKEATIWKEFNNIEEINSKSTSVKSKRNDIYSIISNGNRILFKNPSSMKRISVYDILGNIIYQSEKIDNELKINTNNNKIFILMIETNDGNMYKDKFRMN
ncbi:leucine-rich repeat domain-containing protein [Halosquirtibacter xylanolyticus]|uniref:leucine-rich repeat domain-containing protein n=1 Tax=Halosquirtibacter xylanolyticus TaxID=3374599 RepID=UPI003747952E|nr:leucine-rich repeat domain-containing protein [Prolixibacteraceae bacterium]